MTDLVFLVLLVWFLGSCAGSAIAILLVRGGASRPETAADPAATDRGRLPVDERRRVA